MPQARGLSPSLPAASHRRRDGVTVPVPVPTLNLKDDVPARASSLSDSDSDSATVRDAGRHCDYSDSRTESPPRLAGAEFET